MDLAWFREKSATWCKKESIVLLCEATGLCFSLSVASIAINGIT
jgi:hypothetical protein